MGMDTLPERVRRAILSCLSIEAFDDVRFDRILRRNGLEGQRAVLLDELYKAVVFADCERQEAQQEWEHWTADWQKSWRFGEYGLN